MWWERLRRTSGPIALTASLLLLASCMPGAGSGVGVRGIATELVFGIPEDTDDIPVTPPGFPTEPEAPPVGMIDIPEPAPSDEGPVPLQDPCPVAPITAAARLVATSIVEDPPAEGDYRWVLQGEQETEFGRFDLSGFMARGVEDVRNVANGFAFTTREPEVSLGSPAVVRQTYHVIQGSDVQDDGIYLVRIHRTLYDGQELSFDPEPPIMFFPLPAQIGTPPVGDTVEPPRRVPPRPEDLEDVPEQEEEDSIWGRPIEGPPQMDTVGIDPVSQASLRHSGTVTEKRHIDACGELVDTYYVEAMQEYVSARGNSFQRRFAYAVATQYGGFTAFEQADNPCAAVDDEGNCQPEPTLRYQLRLGQLEPDPAD